MTIAIIGAGLGGLTLARILQLNSIPVTIYEREPTSSSRNQGGSLDLHGDSGQHALSIAGLTAQFRKLVRPESEGTKIVGKDAQITYADEESGPEGNDRPEIDRGQLRDLLLDSLTPGTVKWGYNLSKCEIVGEKVKLTFTEPAEIIEVDVVVGADGTWSRVRPVLTPTLPEYTGVTFIDIQLSDVDGTNAEIGKLIGPGTLCALDDNKGLMAQRNSGGKARVYIALRVPLSFTQESAIPCLVAEQDYHQIQRLLLSDFADWHPSLQELITKCDVHESTWALRPIYSFPAEHSWESNGHVTILGDAAHVMCPFAGEGANLAMLDAAELAEAIVKAKGTDLKDTFKEFEKKMLERSAIFTVESLQNQNLFISEHGAKAAGDLMKELMARGPPPQ